MLCVEIKEDKQPEVIEDTSDATDKTYENERETKLEETSSEPKEASDEEQKKKEDELIKRFYSNEEKARQSNKITDLDYQNYDKNTEEKLILKANKRIELEKPKIISNWSQQHQNLKNHLFHFIIHK